MNTNLILLLLITATVFSACEKENFEYENAFNRSHEKWLEFKASSADSYRYVVTGMSWAGSRWETTITVENGVVTARDFQFARFNNVWMPETGWTSAEADEILSALNTTADKFAEREGISFLEVLQWTERDSQLGAGAHTHSPAAALRTLDEIYDEVREWLKNPEDVRTMSFEAANNGLISVAGGVAENCMDDCFAGISIASIEALDQRQVARN
ncbi:hypothetical protein [Parapedobacter lycopersici]|uniref:hypothetical protein n=1 Tax=Parapedobacter lycopersici TaxID=1864939 RepID=UPI00214D2A42|nr:hypothetical protein [Parapedobacter lycopersici]